ncbi:hypothetical protein ACM66B_002195 [Microbotryomycetes sp. NB124-2]
MSYAGMPVPLPAHMMQQQRAAGGVMPYAVNAAAAQYAMAQQQQQQQQQQMGHARQQQAAAAGVRAQQPQHVQGPVAIVPPQIAAPDEIVATTDVFDVVNARQLASHRFQHNHDLMSTTLDPWTVDMIMEGSRRKREAQDMIRNSRSMLGVPGMTVGPLTALACSATRLTSVGDLASNVNDDTAAAGDGHQRLSLQDRRKRLEQMRNQVERDTLAMQERMREAEAKFKGATQLN